MGIRARDLERGGWIVRAARGQLVGETPAMPELDGQGWRSRLPRAALVTVALDPSETRLELGNGLALPLVPLVGGGALTCLPAGDQRLVIRPTHAAERTRRWWRDLLVPLFVVVVGAWWIGRRLPASSVADDAATRPGGLARLAVALVAALAFAWTLPLAPLSWDHALFIETPGIFTGDPPAPASFDPLEADARMAHASVHRPVQFTLFGALTRLFGADPMAQRVLLLGLHVLGALALQGLLLRALPGGATAGAMLAGLWPVAAQGFTWINGGAIVLAAGFALLGCGLLARALDGGSRPTLLASGLCAALATATKESGAVLAIGGLGLVAVALPGLRWSLRVRGIALSLLVGAAWILGRTLAGLALTPSGVHGTEHGDTLGVLLAALDNLPATFEALARPTLIDQGTEAGHGAFAARPAWLKELFRAGDAAPWGGIGVALLVVASIGWLRTWRGLLVLLVAGGLVTVATLPEILTGTPNAATARRLHLLALVAAAFVGAGLWVGAAPLVMFRRLVLALVLGMALFGQAREFLHRTVVAEVSGRWVQGAIEDAERLHAELEAAPGPGLAPPFAAFSEHRVTEPSSGPVIGPDLAGYLRPPLAPRGRPGWPIVGSDDGRDDAFWRGWPFGLLHLRTTSPARSPERVAFHPPLATQLPERGAPLIRTDGAVAVHGVALQVSEVRASAALRLRFDPPLASGTHLVLAVAGASTPEHRVQLDRLTSSIVFEAPTGPADDAGRAGELEVGIAPAEGRTPPRHEVQVEPLASLPRARWQEKLVGAELDASAPLALAWALPEDVAWGRAVISVRAEGDALGARLDGVRLFVERSAGTVGETGLFMTPVLGTVPQATWQELGRAVRDAAPRARGAWLRFEARGLVGSGEGVTQWCTRSLPLWFVLPEPAGS